MSKRMVGNLDTQITAMAVLKMEIQAARAGVLDGHEEYTAVVGRYQVLSARHAALSVEPVEAGMRESRQAEHQAVWRELDAFQAKIDLHRKSSLEVLRLEEQLKHAREALYGTIESITDPDHE
jgi:hypothetical protein